MENSTVKPLEFGLFTSFLEYNLYFYIVKKNTLAVLAVCYISHLDI